MDQMLRDLSSSQLAEWEAYYLLEPWGYEVENFRSAQVCSTVANFSGRTLKDGQRVAPTDFMPRIQTVRQMAKDPRQLSDEINSRFRALAA